MELLGGRYRLAASLGNGGMGEVFLADDTRLGRRVAIKFLHSDSQHDALARERLRREAMAAAALDHPFICKVYEIGEADDRTFIVMEYVEGDTLQALVRRELLPVRQVAEVANELAQALEEAHRRGVIHRDLKPSNVMLTKQGHVKVMDFGLAKQTVPSEAAGAGSGAATILTESGTRLGTPAYMSPEQVVAGPLDHRSDIFSLGVVLHELTAGAHPFLRDDPPSTMTAILRDDPRPGPRDIDALPGFGKVLGRMLAKASAERFQTMSELRVELEALRDRVWSSTSAALPPAAAPAERTPFVARDSEAGELQRLLDRMLGGHGGLVLVGGEPGVGKTRLARELLREAQQRSAVCTTGHCYEMEGAAPFAPFIEATEQAVRAIPQAVRAAMGELAAEISVVVPSLRRTYGDIPPSPSMPPDQQRRLVFGAYLEYLRQLTHKAPCVVLLDDLHWADEPSLQLLAHMAPEIASLRLLIVGTYRDVDLDVTRPFARTLETLLRQRLATRISLRRLNESGVHQMLSAIHGSPPPSALAKIVFRETEGNPFFVEEVYQHLAEEGKLFDEAGRWKDSLRVGAIDVPEGVRLVIGRRIERLGATARKVLTAAALIGRTFALDLLSAVVDASEDDVLDGVEEAERAQLVAAQTDARDVRYEFVHELIRTTLVNQLSMPRRQRMHLKIADALERLRSASLDTHASVLAHHLYQAGAAADAQRTAKFLTIAGRRALAAGAFEDALDVCDQVLSLDLPEQDPLVAEATERRGNALGALQRPDDAIAALEQALALHIALRDDAGIGRTALALVFALIGWRVRFQEGLSAIDRALQALSSGAAAERAMLQAYSAASHGALAHDEEAWQNIDAAVETAERLNIRPLLGRVLTAKALVQRLYVQYPDALETGRRALELLPADSLWDRAELALSMRFLELNLGRFQAIDAGMTDLESLATRAGNHYCLLGRKVLLWLGELRRTGDFHRYLAEAERALATGRPPQFMVEPILALMATAYLVLGHADKGVQELEARRSQAPPAVHGTLEALLFIGHALTGHGDRARTQFSKVEPWLPAPGRRNIVGSWLTLEAIPGLVLLGEDKRSGALYPVAREYIDTGVVISLMTGLGGPQLVAGIAAHAAGLDERAREHFDIATHQARNLPLRILQPNVQYWYGRMLLEHADRVERSRGRAMVEAAAADFTKLGLVLHANLAEELLRSSAGA